MYDLVLMNNWTASTWKSIIDPQDKYQKLWQTFVPTEAASHPFLMHGILALSALHLASDSGRSQETRREHRAVALRHHEYSIALFRPLLNKITAQNCNVSASVLSTTRISNPLLLPSSLSCSRLANGSWRDSLAE